MSEIMHVKAHRVSPSLKALFDVGQPVAIRCFAVLDGSIRGQIWTDDLAQPTWGAVQEAAFDTLFLGGCPSPPGWCTRLLINCDRSGVSHSHYGRTTPTTSFSRPLPISTVGNWNSPIVHWEPTRSLIYPYPRAVSCDQSMQRGLNAVVTATITRPILGV